MDKAILYQRTLLRVDNAIARLKSIGLNVEPFLEAKNQIVKENSNLVKKSYNYANPDLSLGQTAFLEQDYAKSCSKLEKLYNELLKYEIYAMASSLIDVVKNFINTENKTIEGFNECREQIFTIIKNLLCIRFEVMKTIQKYKKIWYDIYVEDEFNRKSILN